MPYFLQRFVRRIAEYIAQHLYIFGTIRRNLGIVSRYIIYKVRQVRLILLQLQRFHIQYQQPLPLTDHDLAIVAQPEAERELSIDICLEIGIDISEFVMSCLHNPVLRHRESGCPCC